MTDAPSAAPVKAMVSYAWGTEAHQERVRILVDQLIGDGIDVVFDRYHLLDGDDTNQFMEQVAARGKVRKVIAICDPLYVEKMNDRRGGSGREGVIMSQRVYEQLQSSGNDEQQRDRRFIAVIFERDARLPENDSGHLPDMFGPMKFIDMSTSERYDRNYDQLLRFLLDKPEFVAPPLGKVPSHLLTNAAVSAPGQAQAQTIRRLLDQGRPTGTAWRDYLEQVEAVIRAMPPGTRTENGQMTLDFQVMLDEVERFTPVRDGFVAALLNSVQHGDVPMPQLIAFFERLIRVSDQLPEAHRVGSSLPTPVCFYHAEFVLTELVLYMAAVLVNEEQSEALKTFTEHTYFIERYQDLKPSTFSELRRVPEQQTIEDAYRKLSGQNWTSPIGAWLESRATLQSVPRETLVQAELLLFLKSALLPRLDEHFRSPFWYCMIATYWDIRKPFPVIQRWSSRERLHPWLAFFNARSADELRVQLDAAFPDDSFAKYFRDSWNSVAMEALLNISTWGKFS